MRYEEYERKIIKRAKVRRFIYHFRFLFISVISLGVATSGTLVGTKGIVKDRTTLRNKYTYGESYEYLSTAFMSDSIYEFSEFDKDEWTPEEPVFVGKYKMHSKAPNSFNSYYYGKDQVFEIVPKEVQVEVEEDSFVYGAEPHLNISSQLVLGDTLEESYTFSYSDKTKEVWSITPEIKSLKVLSKEGKDVTNCYSFNIKSKNVDILKRNLSISTGSSTKVYDGNKLENTEFEIKSGSLLEGETICLIDNASITDAGSVNNTQKFKIMNNNMYDMTIHYNISLVPGTLTVEKREITVTSPTSEFEYDGVDHKFSLDDIEITDGQILDSHHIEYEYGNDKNYINAGEYTNGFTAVILDSKDVDVSSNYDITFDCGTTTISKRDISILCESGAKTYDKKPISKNGVSITNGSLAGTDELKVTAYDSFTESGEYENDISIQLVNKTSGEEVSSNYNITKEKGSIIINKVNLQVTINSLEVTYDGNPHKNTFYISSGSLVDGDTISEKYNPERVDAGTYDNDDFEINIKDENNLDNSSNYNVSYVNVKNVLKINKRPLTITSLAKEKTYDAKSMRSTFADDESYYSITSGELADDEYLEFTYLNDATDVGEYPIQSEIVIRHQKGEEKDKKQDADVTSNYDITYINNNFTINARDITIKTLDITHEYNRNPNIPTNKSAYEITGDGDGLVEGHSIKTLDVTCPEINVGVHDYIIDAESLRIEDENGHNVTSNYNVTFINSGKLTITKRPASVKLKGDEKVYDAKPLSCSDCEASGLLFDDKFVFVGLPSITHVWESPALNEPTNIRIEMFNGTDVTENYEITNPENGSLVINKREISLLSGSYEKEFDGTPWVIDNDDFEITAGSLAEGDYFKLISMDSIDKEYFHVSDSGENLFEVEIYNDQGTVDASDDLDVTEDYEIHYDYGYVSITPLTIKYQVYLHQYTYNSVTRTINHTENNVTPTSDYVFLTEGVMPTNYSLNVTLYIENMLYVGTYENHTAYTITTEDPHGVEYDDFIVSEVNGVQEIVERVITIRTIGGNKKYDGEPFGSELAPEDRFWIKSGSLGTNDHFGEYEFEDIIEVCNDVPFIIKNVKIFNEDNEDVTENYKINFEYGRVQIYEE